MCVSKITNPNNLYRVCHCNLLMEDLGDAVVSRLRSDVLVATSKSTKVKSAKVNSLKKRITDFGKFIEGV